MAKTSERAQELQATLEDLLVREFRACQALCAYTKEERTALTASDVDRLATLVEMKESLLDEIGMVEESRRTVVEELAEETGAGARGASLPDLLPRLDPAVAGRLNRLRDGILALSGEVRDLTSGNIALTAASVERADSLQSFLLSLCAPPPVYAGSGAAETATPAAWSLDRGA